MKKLIALFTIIVLTTGAVLAQNQKKNDSKKNQETVEFVVTSEDICDNCVKKINNNIAFEKGVTGLNIDQANNLVKVTYRKDKTSPEKLKGAFSKIKMEVEEVADAGNKNAETKDKM